MRGDANSKICGSVKEQIVLTLTVILQVSSKSEDSEISLKVFQIFQKIAIGKAVSIRKTVVSVQMESIFDDCFLFYKLTETLLKTDSAQSSSNKCKN